MELSLRLATPDDAVLIADLSRQTFYETFKDDNTEADMEKFLREQFTRGKLILEVGAPENTFLLAYWGSEVAGYVKLRESATPPSLGPRPSLEIARLYACAPMIGRGVGRLLMQKSIDTARERKKEVVWLGVWERNRRAIDFYRRWGFEKFGDTGFLLGNDLQTDWLMKKELG